MAGYEASREPTYPVVFMIRESPTLASTGQVSITGINANLATDSFLRHLHRTFLWMVAKTWVPVYSTRAVSGFKCPFTVSDQLSGPPPHHNKYPEFRCTCTCLYPVGTTVNTFNGHVMLPGILPPAALRLQSTTMSHRILQPVHQRYLLEGCLTTRHPRTSLLGILAYCGTCRFL